MTTIVFLHAHPDDESTQTSGSMARASAAGDRVVVVYATNGDHGEAPEDLADGETLVHRRRAEAEASAQATGTQRVCGSVTPTRGWRLGAERRRGAFTAPTSTRQPGGWRRSSTRRTPTSLVGYDWHGNYGHPDHVKVHHVAHRAAELAARRPRLLESTMNRDPHGGDRQRAWTAARRPTGTPTSRWTTATRSGCRGRDPLGGRRLRLPRAAPGRRGGPRQPGPTRLDAADARRGVRADVRQRVLHRAGPDRADGAGWPFEPLRPVCSDRRAGPTPD